MSTIPLSSSNGKDYSFSQPSVAGSNATNGIAAAQAQIEAANGHEQKAVGFTAISLSVPTEAATPAGLANSMTGLVPDSIDSNGVVPLPPDAGMKGVFNQAISAGPKVTVATDMSVLMAALSSEGGDSKVFAIRKDGEMIFSMDPAYASQLMGNGGELATIIGGKVIGGNEELAKAVMSALVSKQFIVDEGASEEFKAKMQEGFEITEIIVFDNKDMEKAFMSRVLEAGRENVEEGRAEGTIERQMEELEVIPRPMEQGAGVVEEAAVEEAEVEPEVRLGRHQIAPWGPQVGKSGKTLEVYQQRIILLQLQTMMLVAYQKLLEGKVEARERERFLDGLQKSFEEFAQSMKVDDIKRYMAFMQTRSKTSMFNGREIRVLGELFKDMFKATMPPQRTAEAA